MIEIETTASGAAGRGARLGYGRRGREATTLRPGTTDGGEITRSRQVDAEGHGATMTAVRQDHGRITGNSASDAVVRQTAQARPRETDPPRWPWVTEDREVMRAKAARGRGHSLRAWTTPHTTLALRTYCTP